jgi:hypothetical protein
MADTPVARATSKPVPKAGRARRARPAAAASTKWNPITQPIDRIKMGGKWSPGICDISGASAPRKWEEIGGYGMSGALLVYRGWGISHFSIRLRLYSEDDWAVWDDFKALVTRPPRNTRPHSIDVSHPLLEDLQIRSVVVEDLLVPEQTADGEWTIEIKVIAYRTLTRSEVAVDGGAGDTPLDALDLELLAEKARHKEILDETAALDSPVKAGAALRGLAALIAPSGGALGKR